MLNNDINMSTAEDVFYLYERNSLVYNNDEKKVLPYTIGDQDTPCNLKIKCYIILSIVIYNLLY